MARWTLTGVPHKGWTLIGYEDVKEEDPDAEYESCEMCGNEIRYVHILEHPDYVGTMRVGCNCAEKMTEDYTTQRIHENEMQKRASRRVNFMRQVWHKNGNGNLIIKYKGVRITAIERNGNYGFVIYNNWIWNYRGKSIRSFDTLKTAVFDALDKLV